MRFLFVSNIYPPDVLGGYEILCAQVAEEFARMGHEVTIVTTGQEREGDLDGPISVLRELRLYLPFGRPPRGRHRIRRVRADRTNYRVMRRLLRERSPQRVFVWSLLRLGIGAARAAERSGVPTYYTFNDLHPTGFLKARGGPGAIVDRLFPRIHIDQLALRHCASISATLLANLRRAGLMVPGAKVVYQGIPLESFPSRPDPGTVHDPVRLLYAGQLHEYKGVHTILEALEILATRHASELPEWRLSIAGSGTPEYEERLKDKSRSADLPVEFLGKVPHELMPALYREHDVFVFPSIWDEPFGLTHLEAMASGVPVISTDHAGPGEFLRDNHNALLYPAGDAEVLATRLSLLMRDSELRVRIARDGQRTATQEFSLERYARELAEWLQEPGPPHPVASVHIPRRFVRSNWGGTETVILETVRRLNQAGHPADILTSAALSKPGPDEVQGVPVGRHRYRYPFWGLNRPAREQLDLKGGNLFSLSLLRALLRRREVSLIHLHTGKRLGGIARVAARRLGIPYVMTLHGGVLRVPQEEQQQLLDPLQGTVEWGRILGMAVGARRVLDDAAAILCVDREETEEVAQRYPGKLVRHIPNGVDCGRFSQPLEPGERDEFLQRLGIDPNRRVILNLSRIDPQKNQLLAVDAFSAVLQHHRDAHLLLIGNVTNHSYYREIAAVIESRGLAEHITLVPGIDFFGRDLLRAYRSAEIFFLTSLHEPFGIVVLEAWATGLPVVAPRVGGIPSFAEDLHNAILFPPGDAGAAAAGLRRLLTDPETALSLAKAGGELVRQSYCWEGVVEQLLQVYEHVIGVKR